MRVIDFTKWAYDRHDVYCNQKYDDTLPYSFHLKMVDVNIDKYSHLLSKGRSNLTDMLSEYMIAKMAAAGHDLVEDARCTYNDVLKKGGIYVADVIFILSDCRGKNRKERHSDEFWLGFTTSEIAVFVKLCDILANIKYGLLTNSSMLKTYRKEFANVKKKLYLKRFDEIFVDIEKILEL